MPPESAVVPPTKGDFSMTRTLSPSKAATTAAVSPRRAGA